MLDLPNAQEQAPEQPFPNLILDMVEWEGIGRVGVISEGGRFARNLWSREPKLSNQREGLGHEVARSIVLMRVGI